MRRLVIGGAGFIGIHLAERFLSKGDQVAVFDNLSRKGTRENVRWLKERYPALRLARGDVRKDLRKLKAEMARADFAYHLAAQAAVTTSVTDPREDFTTNALGSFNVLEAARSVKNPPVLFYASTNKVYGAMQDLGVVDRGSSYDYRDLPEGASEERPLDFHSPYGCSKGAADQYFRDYARIYGLKTVVFRQSCIYGERQFGVEDQGWVAWFTIAAILGKPITIYGDGKQVRDILYIQDLVDAFELAGENIETTAGKIYNIGGGRKFTMSLLELLAFLEKYLNKKIPCCTADWRPGDQKVYISDCAKAQREFGWDPRRGPPEGVERLAEWAARHEDLLRKVLK